jgi:hypothetical protein
MKNSLVTMSARFLVLPRELETGSFRDIEVERTSKLVVPSPKGDWVSVVFVSRHSRAGSRLIFLNTSRSNFCHRYLIHGPDRVPVVPGPPSPGATGFFQSFVSE